MSAFASLGVSGASLVLGIINTRSITSLSIDVENIKSVIDPEEPEPVFTTPTEEINSSNIEDRIVSLENAVSFMKDTKDDLPTLLIDAETFSANSLRLDVEVNDTLLDIDNLLELSPDIKDLLDNWNYTKRGIYMGTNGTFIQLNQCKLGLQKNKGTDSSIHFNDIDDPNWTMCASSEALRIKVGDQDDQGFIVESMGTNTSPKGVFSVSSKDGSTTMGSGSIRDMGFSHIDHNYGLSQTSNGLTSLNAAEGKEVQLCVNGEPKVWTGSPGQSILRIKNNTGVSDTHFDKDGENIIVSRNGSYTRFRTGASETDSLIVGNTGVHVNGDLFVSGVDIKQTIKTFYTRMEAIDGELAKQYIEDMNNLANPQITDGYFNPTIGPPTPVLELTPGTYSMVKIYNNHNAEALSLGEVEILDENNNNVARNPSKVYDIWQTDMDYGGEASRAVNGVIHGDYARDGITHTKSGSSKIWRVSFKVPIQIMSIRIYPRTDSNYDRLYGCQLHLLRNSDVVKTRQLEGINTQQTFFFYPEHTIPAQLYVPTPPPDPRVHTGDTIALRNVASGIYLERSGSADDMLLRSWGVNNPSSLSCQFILEEVGGTGEIQSGAVITMMADLYYKYIQYSSPSSFKSNSTDPTSNNAKFQISSTTPGINSGDVVSFYNHGAAKFLRADSDSVHTGQSSSDPNCQFYIVKP